jgi:cell division protein FtsB
MNRKLLRRRKYWTKGKKWVQIFLVALVGLWIVDSLIIGDYGLYELVSLKRKEVRIQNKILALQAKREILIREKKMLEDDLFTIERIAREQLGMIKPGEKKILFHDGTNKR